MYLCTVKEKQPGMTQQNKAKENKLCNTFTKQTAKLDKSKN